MGVGTLGGVVVVGGKGEMTLGALVVVSGWGGQCPGLVWCSQKEMSV